MTAYPSQYTGLITSEHANATNFVAMVSAVTGTMVDLQNFLSGLPAQFSVGQAVGAQLDAVGLWVGINRNLSATVPGLFVQAPDPTVVPLGDPDYRTAVSGKISANGWNGTIVDAFGSLVSMLGPTSYLFMVDHQDMTMDVAVSGDVPDAGLQAALKGEYLQVRPAAVLANYYFPSAPGGPLFGLDVENQFISGLDVGVWAVGP